MRRVLAALALVCALAVSVAAKKPQGVPTARRLDQVAEIAGVSLARPGQSCSNWAWAAALEAILRQQKVDLSQKFWVQKLNGGELCMDRPIVVHESGRRAAPDDVQPQDLDLLASGISGDYTLDDGRKFKLSARSSAGLPVAPDALIADARAGRPSLIFWNNRAYLLYSITYDELIYPTGQREFITKQLKLLDPLESGEKQKVSFVIGQDDVAEIQGVVQVTATPVLGTNWDPMRKQP